MRPHLRPSKAALKEPTTSWVVNQERVLNTIQVLTRACMVGRSRPATTAQLAAKVTEVLGVVFEYIGVQVLVWR